MSQQYFDPRAPLDYSDFLEVGEMEVVRRVPKGIDADYLGPNPRQTPFAVGERERFEQVRQRLDKALQVTRIVPSTPQEHQTPAMYEASLLKELARHAGGRVATIEFSKQLPPEEVIATLNRHDVVGKALEEPSRQGRLAEIKTVDQTGREIKEFVGSKSTWMAPLKGPMLASPIFIDGEPQRV